MSESVCLRALKKSESGVKGLVGGLSELLVPLFHEIVQFFHQTSQLGGVFLTDYGETKRI